jgi:hypothetical protein
VSKNRKSPPISAWKCWGKTQTGLDGKKWEAVETKNGVIRWVHASKSYTLPLRKKSRARSKSTTSHLPLFDLPIFSALVPHTAARKKLKRFVNNLNK